LLQKSEAPIMGDANASWPPQPTGPPPLDDAAQYWLTTRDEVWIGYYLLAALTLAMPFVLLKRYSNPLTNPLVILMCGGGWGISIAMIVLAPLDLSGTYHTRCLHTQLEWAGQFELLVNETYSWRLEPAEDGEYAEQRMYAALIPWAPQRQLAPDAFDAVQLPPYKTCVDEDLCPSWSPAPALAASRSATNMLQPGRMYELQMSTAPTASEFLIRVKNSGSYALVTEHMPYKFIALDDDDEDAEEHGLAHPEKLRQVLAACDRLGQDHCAERGRYVDFSTTPELNANCLDTEQVHRHTMQSALRFCYWTLFFLGWMGVPFVQGAQAKTKTKTIRPLFWVTFLLAAYCMNADHLPRQARDTHKTGEKGMDSVFSKASSCPLSLRCVRGRASPSGLTASTTSSTCSSESLSSSRWRSS
jgi:hypothetical protein